MKNKDLNQIKRDLACLVELTHKDNNKFSYAVMRSIQNVSSAEKEIKGIVGNIKRPDTTEVKEYNKAVAELITKYALKNKDGKVILDANNQPRIKEIELFEKEKEQIDGFHSEALAAIQEHEDLCNTELDKTAKVIFHKTTEADLPPMNAIQLEIVYKYLLES